MHEPDHVSASLRAMAMRLGALAAAVLAVASCEQIDTSSRPGAPRTLPRTPPRTLPRTLPRTDKELAATLTLGSRPVLLKATGPDVYFAMPGGSGGATTYALRSLVHHVPLWQAVYGMALVNVSDAVLDSIPKGPDQPFFDSVLLHGDGSQGEPPSTIYVTEAEQRRVYPDADTLAALNVDPKAAHAVSDAVLRELPVGRPVPRPSQMYVIAIDNFHIDKTRARHRDTLAAATSLKIGDFRTSSAAGYRNRPTRFDRFGDMDDGTHPTTIAWGPLAANDLDDVIVSYAFINSPSISNMSLDQIQWILAYEGLYGLWMRQSPNNRDPRSLLAALGFRTDPDSRPIPGYITSKIGWHPIGLTQGPTDLIPLALAITNSGLAVLNPNCDGPVALDAVSMPVATLRSLTTDKLVYRETRSYAGTTSPDGCGSNSRYSVTWSARRIGGLEVAAPLAFGSQELGGTAYRSITVRNLRRDRAIQIRNVRSSDAHFVPSGTSLVVPLADQDGKAPATAITVQFKPDAIGNVAGQLVMDTDDLEDPSVSIAMSGSGIAACVRSCDRTHCGQSDGCNGICGCPANQRCDATTHTCEKPEEATCPRGQVLCDCDEPARCMPAATCKRICRN